jgi:histidinol-phosphate phosphatase family protein
MKTIFLDRDGVLCEDTDYITNFDKLHIFPFSKDAVAIMKSKGYRVIVISNQSAVARGMLEETLLQEINGYLKQETGVDAIYYCPHLPPEGEEIEPYRVVCTCRKPGIGLIERASQDFDIDMSESYMVGDRLSDIQTGKRAGLKTVYIKEKESKEYGYDLYFKNIKEFAQILN